jgi:hypothetical protein
MARGMKQFLIALDQLLNAALGGYADETLSARAWRVEQTGKIFGKIFRPLIDFVLFFDPQHCYKSYLSEKERRQFPNHYRNP